MNKTKWIKNTILFTVNRWTDILWSIPLAIPHLKPKQSITESIKDQKLWRHFSFHQCVYSLVGKLHYNDVIMSTMAFQITSLNRLFRRSSKKTSKLRITGLCAGNSTGTGEFPAQMVSNAENGSIWWRHHGKCTTKNSIRFRVASQWG